MFLIQNKIVQFRNFQNRVHTQRVELSIMAIGIFSILFALKDPSTYQWYKAFVAFTVLGAILFYKKPYLKPVFWLALLVYHTPLLAKNFYMVANHYFVLIYGIVAILIYLIFQRKEDRLIFHLTGIVAFIMIFGGLHKLLEPSYLNGSFLMYQIDMGVFLKPFVQLFPEWKEATLQNVKWHKEIQHANPAIFSKQSLIAPTQGLRELSLLFSCGSILMELITGIFVAIFPRKKITHVFLLLTIACIFIFRLETGFLSLITAMVLAWSPKSTFTYVYLVFFIFFSALLIAGIGLR